MSGKKPALADEPPARAAFAIRAVSPTKLLISKNGRTQQYVVLRHVVDQVVENPVQPFAAAFSRGKQGAAAYIYFFNLRTAKRRRLVLIRPHDAWLVEHPAALWSPDGSHLQLTKLIDHRGVLVPREISVISTKQLALWIDIGRWQHSRILLPLKDESPTFLGWLREELHNERTLLDAREEGTAGGLAIQAEAGDGTTRYYLYDLTRQQLSLYGTCPTARPTCPNRLRLLQRLEPGHL